MGTGGCKCDIPAWLSSRRLQEHCSKFLGEALTSPALEVLSDSHLLGTVEATACMQVRLQGLYYPFKFQITPTGKIFTL